MNSTLTYPHDQHLDRVALAQFTFKGDKLRAVGVAVAKAFSGLQPKVWADEVQLPELGPDDRNIVGTAWKNLARWGIIQRMEGEGDHRRSTRPGRRGGIVFRYRLTNQKLLETFLARNGVANPLPVLEQKELL